MANISLKDIGSDPLRGAEIIDQPIDDNFTTLKTYVEQNLDDIVQIFLDLDTKADKSNTYTIGAIGTGDINNDTGITGVTASDVLNELQTQINNLDTDEIENLSDIVGVTLTNVLNNIKSDFDTLNSDEVLNNSEVIGTQITDALNNLSDLIEAIQTADSNAQIGLYPLIDSVNTNNYVASYNGLTLFAGLSVILSVSNANTGVSTLDISDGSGAKSIKYFATNGVKTELSGNEIRGLATMYYDGVEWLLTNKKDNYNITVSTIEPTSPIIEDVWIDVN